MRLFFALILSLSGCAHFVHRPLVKGDIIKYRFSGSYYVFPIDLTQKVINTWDQQVTLLVHRAASDGDWKWQQRIDRSDINRPSAVIHKLVETTGKLRKKLRPTAEELSRLYKGAFLIPAGKLHEAHVDHVEAKACGETVKAKRTVGKKWIGEKVYYFEEVVSEAFPWYLISARVTTRAGEVFYNADIVQCKVN